MVDKGKDEVKVKGFTSFEMREFAKEIGRIRKKNFRHDSFGRRIFNVERGKKFVHYLFRNKPAILENLDVDKLRLGQSSFTDKKLNNHSVDVHYVIPIKGEKDKNCVVSVLIELKAQNHFWTMLQMVVYIVNIWVSMFKSVSDAVKRKGATAADKKRSRNFLLPTVIPVIFHQGRGKFSAPTKLSGLIRTITGLESHTLDMEAILVDLSCLREEDEPDELDLWVPFRACRMVFDEDPESRLMEIVDKMLPEIHYPVMQELLVDVLNYGYFNTPKLTETICEKIRKYTEEKGGIKMPVCLYDKMLAKIQKAEAKIQKAEAEAQKFKFEIQKAETEAQKFKVEVQKVEAEKREYFREAHETCVKTILGFLRHRFGKVSEEMLEKLQQIDDLRVLRELSDYVEICPTVEAFQNKIDKNRMK
ncbi:MAG: Rpn family recombination-promoting nuclease/putative transposase [Planctomycetaceae bacterium]|jgi:hypothetical protein|nr:Rpn family recombination-promoting nuclease/putative transposase [Planctomycetaceae bacterium]